MTKIFAAICVLALMIGGGLYDDRGEEVMHFEAFYYRADSSSYSAAPLPVVVKLSSVAELNDYFERNKDFFQFERGYFSETSMLVDVFDGNKRFDEVFFEEKFLLFVLLQEGSGSIRHRVDSVLPENGSLVVNIARFVPEIGTADMAHWHLVLVLDRSLVDMDVAVELIQVNIS